VLSKYEIASRNLIMPDDAILDRIRTEIRADPYYSKFFPNEGQRFVAWYLRRVLLRDPAATRLEVTDGADDKQIDAVVVDEEGRRVVVVQGKFFTVGAIDGGVLREVLSAWVRFHDLASIRSCPGPTSDAHSLDPVTAVPWRDLE
jgi:hypothetical protein